MRPLGDGQPVADGRDGILGLPGGLRLAVTRWAGGGPTLVLLHGLASQRRFWGPVVRQLAGHDVLAVDLRGHGDSDQPPDGYDVATVAGDVVQALDVAGVGDAVLVGHSWGAAIALAAAAGRAPRVPAVVAIDGGFLAPLAPDDDRAAVRRRLEPPRMVAPPEAVIAMLRSAARPWWTPRVEQAVLPIFGVGEDGSARARLPFELHMRVVDGLLDHDPGPVLAALRVPVWLVSCEPTPGPDPGDGTGEWAARKATALAAAGGLLARPRLMRWAGAVHDVPLQWPALVAGLLRAAVGEVTPGDG